MEGRENRIGSLMKAKGVRDAVLAVHCDVDQSTIWRWRVGKSVIPDEQKLRLAAYFDVPVGYLMGWDDLLPSEAAA